MRKIYSILLSAMLLSIMPAKLSAQVDLGDSLALVDLYNNTDGAHWHTKTNWLTANPVITWYGIGVVNNRVDSIKLTGNDLMGPIPSSIGNITGLRTLNLSKNYHIASDLPATIGNLIHLTYLNLAYDALTGDIPFTIGNLIHLRYFGLNSNELTGNIPTSIGNLKLLDTLDLDNNNLQGFITPAIYTLGQLSYLDLRYNKLSGSISPFIGKLINLTYLNLTYNQLSGSIPDSIGNLKQLHSFYAEYNKLTGNIPFSIGNLANLQILYLSNNQLSGKIPGSIGNFKNLRYLYLYNNQLSGSIPSSIGNLESLQNFTAFGNQLQGSIPASIGKLTNLETLELEKNQLTGSIPNSIGDLINLQGLYLSDNRLTGNIPNTIGNLINLKGLYLSRNQLTGLPLSISNCLNMKYLFIDNNKLVSVPPSIGMCKNLEELFLNNNELTGVPSSIGNLTNLRTLYVDHNKLTGSIPLSFTRLSPYCTFDFSNNELSGLIPNPPQKIGAVIYLNKNHYNFDAFEPVISKFNHLQYYPQKNIYLHKNGNTLSVYAGGTVSNNTYQWYKNGILVKTAVGDSTYINNSGAGKYTVTVTNNVVRLLTLYSDTLILTTDDPMNFIVINNGIAINSEYKSQNLKIALSPNPAKDFLNIHFGNTTGNTAISIYDEGGKKVYNTQMAVNSGQMADVNISKLAPGNYFISVSINGQMIKEQFIKVKN